jgi:protein-S-isoprenylcysteine O-methyltransferase Ste14
MSDTARLDRSGKNRIAIVLGTILLFGTILFIASGRLDWPEAWIFLAIYLVGTLVFGIWVLRHNPAVINERGRVGQNTKSWDKLIGVFYTVFLLGILILAGLDARFAWSVMPLWAKIVGGIAFVFSLLLAFSAMLANTFLSTFVRIQDDRGHTTVTGGPYRFVRHPMYAGSLFMYWGMPLMLGSWWALIPGVLNIIVLVVRTTLEDRTLQAELPGYKEYTQKVRYRLIPGIW